MEEQEDEIELIFYMLLSGDTGISGPYLSSDDLTKILTSDDGSQTLTPN